MSSATPESAAAEAAAEKPTVNQPDAATVDRRKLMKRTDTPSPEDLTKNIANLRKSAKDIQNQMKMSEGFAEEEEEE